jgi:hypothetical protein
MNPADRPQSAREFLQRLEEVIRGLPQDADGNDISAADGSLVGVPVVPVVTISGPNSRKSGPRPGAIPQLPQGVRPITVPYDGRRRALGIAGIGFAVIVLLYVAFFGGKPNGDGPDKLADATAGARDPDPPEVKLPVKPPPTKIVPPIPPPTKVDPGAETGDDTGEAKVEPIKKVAVEPRPRLDPKSDQCKALRDKVNAARNGGNFHDMLRLLNDRDCWASKAEHGKLRTLAFKELGKFKECAKAGQNNSDPDVVRWVKLCERRAEPG